MFFFPLSDPPCDWRGRADEPLASTATAVGGRDSGAGRSRKDNPFATGIAMARARTATARTSRFLRQPRSWATLKRRSHSPPKQANSVSNSVSNSNSNSVSNSNSNSPMRTSSGIFGSLQKGLRGRMSRYVTMPSSLFPPCTSCGLYDLSA